MIGDNDHVIVHVVTLLVILMVRMLTIMIMTNLTLGGWR